MKINIIFASSMILLVLFNIIIDKEIGIQLINIYQLLLFISSLIILGKCIKKEEKKECIYCKRWEKHTINLVKEHNKAIQQKEKENKELKFELKVKKFIEVTLNGGKKVKTSDVLDYVYKIICNSEFYPIKLREMELSKIKKVLDEVIDLQTNHNGSELIAFDKILSLREGLNKRWWKMETETISL